MGVYTEQNTWLPRLSCSHLSSLDFCGGEVGRQYLKIFYISCIIQQNKNCKTKYFELKQNRKCIPFWVKVFSSSLFITPFQVYFRVIVIY